MSGEPSIAFFANSLFQRADGDVGALRDFLEAAICEVSIVKVEAAGDGGTTLTSGTQR